LMKYAMNEIKLNLKMKEVIFVKDEEIWLIWKF
jgi:hypothetical protein